MLEILLFGPAALAVGARQVRVRVPDRATAHDVLAALSDQHAVLRFALPGARLAVNCRFANPDTPVQAGDELALIAMVGGG